jgi:hypothetical protein
MKDMRCEIDQAVVEWIALVEHEQSSITDLRGKLTQRVLEKIVK